MKKKLLLTISLFGLALGAAFVYKQTAKPSAVHKELFSAINTEEQEMWKMLEESGATRANFEEYKKAFYKSKPEVDLTISPEVIARIHGIIDDFGIDHKAIGIQKYVDTVSPAAAENNTIFVDEYLMKDYSPLIIDYILAHELQHILCNDDCLGTFAEKYVTSQSLKRHEHPIARLRRFQERRADALAITHNKKYAEGQVAFMNHFISRFGDKPSLYHPKKSERLLVAQNVIKNQLA